ncbi:MAG: hypothetical protein QXJ17_04780 [Nitrososphaeria archaeon]
MGAVVRSGNKKLVAIAFALSIIFTITLLYTTLELPNMLNTLLVESFPDYGLKQEEAEQFLSKIRPISYICFITTIALIIFGIVLRRHKLAKLGSLVLYLPTFSYFASTMFFLTGIGILRIIWLPMIELAPGDSWSQKIYAAATFLELGDSVYIPYDMLRFLFTSLIRLRSELVDSSFFNIIVYLSALIFFVSCTTWFYAKFKGIKIIDFSIYKYVRHPQYLSFILWSYALLIFDKYLFRPPKGGYFAPPPLVWLIAVFSILVVALHEESVMIKTFGQKYEEYRRKTPFIIPLPKMIPTAILLPFRKIFNKEHPERNFEIAFIFGLYGVILIIISIFY